MTLLRSRFRLSAALVALALTAWIFWLRAPGLGVTMWNVDETIHAAVARTLLDGGVMYRDAVDQRTPLTYYAFAAVFGVAGVNNLFAIRVVIAGLIVATAFGLFLLGRRTRGPAAGLWAAGIYAALANYLLFPGDANAAHTEWFVASFTTAAAVVFLWRDALPSFRRSFVVGALFALAFLSKQPGLADLGAPFGTLVYLVALRVTPWREALRSALGGLAGFAAVVTLALGALVTAGAGPDLLFYTWTYNVHFYGPEISTGTRLLSIAPFFRALAQLYPLVLATVLLGAVAVAFRLAQSQPPARRGADRRWEIYLLLWCATSLLAALSSGRGFYHYFFQCLPPFAWLAAWLPARLTDHVASGRTVVGKILAGFFLAALAFTIVRTPLAARHIPAPPADPALRLSAFIRSHSTKTDKIFVWGYNPDIYLYSNRGPASRFVYCSFQTGLIPWTNEAPGIDTRYAIVPGAMDTLLRDLACTPPVFIVDCGVGPHRRFTKYPLNNFEPLRAYVASHYVEVDPERYSAQGFRLFMRRDRPLASAASPSATLPARVSHDAAPALHTPSVIGIGATSVFVSAGSWEEPAMLSRLSLVLDGTEAVAVRFPTAPDMVFRATLDFTATDAGTHQLIAVAEWSDGTRTASQPTMIKVVPLLISPAQRSEFALPIVQGQLPSTGVRALLNPTGHWTPEGAHEFALHAPSLVQYTLPKGATALRGRYGLPPGAYAPENKAPSDGAEFIVRAITPDGREKILLSRLLRPDREPADRPVQSFRVPLAGLPAGTTLELEVSPGPDGNPSSDWAYWSDVELETSP